MVVLLAALIICMFAVMWITPSLLKNDFNDILEEEKARTNSLQAELEERLQARRAELATELAAIDANSLRRSAEAFYHEELAGRQSYDQRFALSPRERAQLQMKMLATDTTHSFHDSISSVAREAAPPGSDISVRETSRGLELHIYFDMSAMTSGEHGTRTKHNTVASLKKEVGILISRVMNDVALFCKEMNLATIHVACRHHVETHMADGSSRDVNTVLYKTYIRHSAFLNISGNPFLDVYSSRDQFVVDEDHFDTIEIITTK